ncbi:MAG: hypothetical protein A2X36_16985 [Elusimicrobia bacterium GWA2_69_24]|nr:MAG: hypothetical protein A2X36_16985 [Elusimicrobia bacterium GWA2_69_24]HBL16127.1 hypothetical protein [Elusimicrobiota bacterium]
MIASPPSLEVRSVGERVLPGRYSLHSGFAAAANYVSGDGLFCIVSLAAGPGPFSLVADGPFPELWPGTAVVEPGLLRLGTAGVPLPPGRRYDGRISCDPADAPALRKCLIPLREALLRSAPERSAAFLIEPSRDAAFASPSGREYAAALREGVVKLLGPDPASGARRIRGLGPGFTPAGDDLLCGYLGAGLIAEKVLGLDLRETREAVGREAQGGNPLSNSSLRCAVDGCFADKFRDLILACLGRPGRPLESCVEAILELGATSGADLAVGFFLAARRFSGEAAHGC